MIGSAGVRSMYTLEVTFAFKLMSYFDFFKTPGNAACFFW